MFRPVCTQGASQLRRMLNGPRVVNVRNFWLRPWFDHRPLSPVDRSVDRWFRQVEREMDRAYDTFRCRNALLRSPIIFGREVPVEVAGDGSRRFILKVDVSQFAPEEVRVTVRNRLLTVRARHEETAKDGGNVYREYASEYTLPSEVNGEAIRSVLDKDGMLTIEASLPAVEAPKETEIPIEKKDEASAKN